MQLKNKNFSVFLFLFLISIFYLPNTFAQNPTRWNLPEGAIARFGKGTVTKNIAFSPDGTQFAISRTTGIWLYDAETYQETRLFTMGGTQVFGFAFSPDGKTLAGKSLNGTTNLWDVATGHHKQTLDTRRHTIFSPDSETLVEVDWRQIRLWDVTTGQLMGQTKRDVRAGDPSYVITLSSDGRTFAGLQDGTLARVIVLWDTSTKPALYLRGHKDIVTHIAFSPDGATLASGSWDKTIRVWDVATGRIKNILTGHSGYVNSVVFSPDGSTLLSGSDDSTIRVWDVATGIQKQILTGHEAPIYRIALSPDGSILMSGSDDYALYFWDVATGQHLKTLRENVSINDIAFSPDGMTLADGNGRIWDSTGKGDNTIRIWDVATGQLKQTFTGHTHDVKSIAFSPDGVTLASGSSDRTIRLWDIATGNLRKILTAHKSDVRDITFSPDGVTLASGDSDSTIRIWDVATGQLKQTLNVGTNIRGIAFSPDGVTLADGNSDSTIRIWDVATGQLKQTFIGHGDRVNSVAFNPDGSILVSASQDNTIRVWNARTGQHIKTFVGHEDRVFNVAFSPDGKILASGSADNTIRLWDALTGKHFETQVLIGHTRISTSSGISSISFSPDGKTFASGADDGIILLWDITQLAVETESITRPPAQAEVDVNGDGVVNIQDLVLVASNFGETRENIADVNGDGVVNIEDLVKVARAVAGAAGAPALWDYNLEIDLTRVQVHQWLREARKVNLKTLEYQRGILMLEQLLITLTPKETTLLPNYPNPFNPETWIPYQLAEPANVTVSIYSADGKLIRTLRLGNQPVGIYESRNRAAYWDGKNEIGESVASGIYFYMLSAGKFTATRKMLIRK